MVWTALEIFSLSPGRAWTRGLQDFSRDWTGMPKVTFQTSRAGLVIIHVLLGLSLFSQ